MVLKTSSPALAPPASMEAEAKRILAEANRRKAEIDREALEAVLALTRHRSVETQPIEPKWISLDQAAAIRGVTRETMALHASQHGLGTFTSRRWRIDEVRVRALNEGREYELLNPHPDSA